MKRNYKDEYRHSYNEALRAAIVYKSSKYIVIYLSLTKYGKKVFNEMNRKTYEDLQLDFNLGVISEEEYKLNMYAYYIMEESIANCLEY